MKSDIPPNDDFDHPSSKSTSSMFFQVGTLGLYIALSVTYLWSGAMRFSGAGIGNAEAFVTYSPLLAWAYSFLTVTGISDFVGGFELLIGVLIAGRPLSPKLSVAGGIFSALLFFTSLTFMLSTPGLFTLPHNLSVLSIEPGEFLLKDLTFFVLSLLVIGNSLAAIEQQETDGS